MTDDTCGSLEALCEDTGGAWDAFTCMDYVCGVPNDCEAIIPGCNCGAGRNYSAGEGCVTDATCSGCTCPDVYDPVCGTDGMTYGNTCEAHCGAAVVAYNGPCQ